MGETIMGDALPPLPSGFTPVQSSQELPPLPDGFSPVQDAGVSAPTTFPEKRGTTRAAQELPELGTAGLLGGENKAKILAISPVLLTTTNDDELADIVASNFPNIGKSYSPAGEILLRNNNTGAEVIVNKPGLSRLDVIQGLGIAAAYTPAGRSANIVGLGTKELAKGSLKLAAKSGATQSAIETSQAAAGGEFNTSDIATSAALAPIAQIAGEKVISPVARVVGGKISESAKELLKSAKQYGVDILTTDVLPPNTFATKTLQHLGEKLGFLGTGGKRAAQQKTRIEIVENLAQDFGLTLDAPIEKDIFSSLKSGVAKELKKGADLMVSSSSKLDDYGIVPPLQTLKKIDTEIAKQKRLRGDASEEIISRLESLKSSIVDADFSLIKDLRSNLIDDIRAAYKGEALPTKSVPPLQSVKTAIDGDLLNFAKKNDRSAAADWLTGNKIFSDGSRKAKDTEIRRLLNKGEGTPELVSTILKGGKPSELNRLNSTLDDAGRKAAQLSIMRDALTESGFFTKGANPTTFANALLKPQRQKAINVFFKGDSKKQLEGITRVLNETRRAQEAAVSTATGQQLFAPVLAAGAATVDAGVSFGTAGTLAGISRAYESAGMRHLLLKLANTPKGSAAEQKILQQIMPFFNSASQAIKATGDNNE